MRRFHYANLSSLGFYGLTALPLIGSLGLTSVFGAFDALLCRSTDGRLVWVDAEAKT